VAAARRADYESFRNAARGDEDQLLSCTILTRRRGRGRRRRRRRWKELRRNCIKAGVKALQSKDYRGAIDLLKRAVDGDASMKDVGTTWGWPTPAPIIMSRRSLRSANRSTSIRITSTQMATWRWSCQQTGRPTTRSRPIASNWRRLRTRKRRTRISACCWRSWGGMQMPARVGSGRCDSSGRSGNEDGAGAGVRAIGREGAGARVDEGIDGQCKRGFGAGYLRVGG